MKPTYLWMRPLLGILIVVGFLFVVIKLSLGGLKTMSKEAWFLYGAVIQTVILLAKDCFGFYFGSSQGSANKAETIDNMLNGEEEE